MREILITLQSGLEYAQKQLKLVLELNETLQSELAAARAGNDAVLRELPLLARAAEMQANIMRDQNRTKAHGPVHAMCLRVANAFDVHAVKLRALGRPTSTPQKDETND